MSTQLNPRPHHGSNAWLETAVFGLDRWLRHRQGVYEYAENDGCLFRIQPAHAEESLTLSDGTKIAFGDPILNLHIWNEHMPLIADEGLSLAWARRAGRAIDASLRDLANYLAPRAELDDIVAIRAELRLGTAEQSEQLARLSAHFGFEEALVDWPASGIIHRLGENVLIFLLVMVSNPAASRAPVLWRDRKLVYLSRAALERRYATGLPLHAASKNGMSC